MNFSPDVNHKSVVNWWKKIWCSTTNMPATPLFVSKLWERLAPVLFEIFQKNFFWWGSRPISVTQWKEFQISLKKWRFEIFRTSAPSRYFKMSTDSECVHETHPSYHVSNCIGLNFKNGSHWIGYIFTKQTLVNT